jgi:hypothetical protein
MCRFESHLQHFSGVRIAIQDGDNTRGVGCHHALAVGEWRGDGRLAVMMCGQEERVAASSLRGGSSDTRTVASPQLFANRRPTPTVLILAEARAIAAHSAASPDRWLSSRTHWNCRRKRRIYRRRLKLGWFSASRGVQRGSLDPVKGARR